MEQAKAVAAAKIADLQDQLKSCIQALERIKNANAPAAAPKAAAPQAEPAVETSDVADEIAQNIQAMIGSTDDKAPTPAPKHPTNDTTTSKFASLNLQFGRNYDPGRR